MRAYPCFSAEDDDPIRVVARPKAIGGLMVEIGPHNQAGSLDLLLPASVARRLIAAMADQLALLPPPADTLDGHPALEMAS